MSMKYRLSFVSEITVVIKKLLRNRDTRDSIINYMKIFVYIKYINKNCIKIILI